MLPADPVFGVELDGETKAYPQSVLVWHEISNDVVGGVPVSVTYCPLTGSALGFYRGENSFGTTGNLLNSNLVMYDRDRIRGGRSSSGPRSRATTSARPSAGSA